MTEQTPAQVPAGWYPDGSGQQRFWDGTAWTQDVQPSAPQAAGPVGAPPFGTAPKNGLGVAALVLGIIGLLFGFIPFLFFLSGTLGLIGLILGLVGWSRARKGVASNGKVAVAGVILSILALIAAVIGVVLTVTATKAVVDSINTASGQAGISSSCAGTQYADQQTTDVCASSDGSVTLGSTKVAVTPFARTADATGVEICTNVTVTNTGTSSISFNQFDYKLQTPSGEVLSFEFSTQSTLGSGDLVAGGTKTGAVCFPDQPGVSGQYVLIYKPNPFDAARGIWIGSL